MPIYVEPAADRDFSADRWVADCIEGGAGALLVDRVALPDAFFDLSSRVAGELLHGLSKYGLRLAVVIDDVADHSDSFRDFVREANAGRQFRFFPSRAEAVAWLESIEPEPSRLGVLLARPPTPDSP